MGYDIIQNGI